MICLSAFSIYKIITPKTEEEVTTLYSYTMTAGGDYKVHLKENEIYSNMVMEENMIYPKSIFDKLSVNFHAEFAGSQDTESNIRLDYAIEVIVRGFQVKGDEKRIVYEKIFPLVKHYNWKYLNSALMNEEVSIDFTEYEDYINNVESILNADPSSEALLVFKGKFTSKTEFGKKEEEFSYSIPLPLFESLFTIDKPAFVEKTDSITQVEFVDISLSKYLLFIPGTIIFIMLLLITYITLFTIPPTEEEKLVLKFKSIMRKHGSRIVRVSRYIGASWERVMVINDIEGMIKISDECNIPIFYISDERGMPLENSMFIPTKDINYKYYLSETRIPLFPKTTT
ncbi:MAG: DUF5305 domain-containing protein [Tissierellia bacterium]|nr:DUF5305 domain-containing protein [Tissierellia bacterium]